MGTLFEDAFAGRTAEVLDHLHAAASAVQPKDDQGATVVHWAAAGNHVSLLETVHTYYPELVRDALDLPVGEMQARPLHWAAKNGHFAVCQWLLKQGVLPNAFDSNKTSPLSLACQSGNVALVFLLAMQPDVHEVLHQKDSNGLTPLAWAIYTNGTPAEIPALLCAFGADINQTTGDYAFTAMHWAAFRGRADLLRLLIRRGGDPKLRTSQHQSVLDLWLAAGRKRGFFQTILHHRPPAPFTGPDRANIFVACVPIVMLATIAITVTSAKWVTSLLSLPAVLGVGCYGVHRFAFKSDTDLWSKSYFLPSLFHSSLALIAINQIHLHAIGFLPFDLSFFLLLLLAEFFLLKTSRDATHIPANRGRADAPERIQEIGTKILIDQQLDLRTFCFTCMIQRPLRSKHCKVCDVCTPKFDHHCPWLGACVGAGNHRAFVLFIWTLAVLAVKETVTLFFSLSFPDPIPSFANHDRLSTWDPESTCLFTDEMCAIYQRSPLSLFCGIWTLIQVLWVVPLAVFHVYTITKARTTNEGCMSIGHHSKLKNPFIEDADFVPGHAHERQTWMDNPFDGGVRQNCAMFWRTEDKPGAPGWPTDTDWRSVYTVPDTVWRAKAAAWTETKERTNAQDGSWTRYFGQPARNYRRVVKSGSSTSFVTPDDSREQLV